MKETNPFGKLSPEEKRKLLEKLLLEKAGSQTPSERTEGAPAGQPVPSTVRGHLQNGPGGVQTGNPELGSQAFPGQGLIFPEEYRVLQQKFAEFERLGYGDIYFAVADGINNHTISLRSREYINFTSYNYLGLSGDPEVSAQAKAAIDQYGTSVSASRLVSGERSLHRELESALAKLLGVQDCLVLVGGYGTNETVVGNLLGSGDLILYDSLIHASVQAGAKASEAAVRPFPHNNWEALDGILAAERGKYRQVLIVIEGVYSMDGDIPDLPHFIAVKQKHRALLMIDEAHSLGVLGEHGAGVGEYHRVNRQDVEIWMGTLSKTLASCGGYIAGNRELIEYLKFTMPGFVYSVGMSPPNAAAALAALRLMEREPARIGALHQRAALFLELAKNKGINTGPSRDSAVIPVMVGNSLGALKLYQALFERGIYALPLMYPAVPENLARLRFFISSTHTEEQIRTTVAALEEAYPYSITTG